MPRDRSRSAFRIRLAVLFALTFVGDSAAQLPYGKLDWVFPPGGQSGQAIDATIGGTDLDVAEVLVFSHPDITSVQQRTAATEFEPARPIPNRFTIRIGDGVPTGIYDVRAVGRFGASTPRAYQVGNKPERVEPVDNQTVANACPLQVGETLNGRTNANAADFYRLKLSAGQRVLIRCVGDTIDSQIDGTLSILAANGREIVTSRDHSSRDPLIDFVAPDDDEYLLKVFDFTYLGGNNHFYRIVVTEEPVIDFTFPPAIQPGKSATLTLYGWNLPGSTVHKSWTVNGRPMESFTTLVTAPPRDPLGRADKPLGLAKPISADVDGFCHRLQTLTTTSNPFFVAFAEGPVVQERSDNDRSKSAQPVNVPCEVVGQFFPARDEDWFEFAARKGDVWWLEVFSQRHGVPSDPYMLIQRIQKNADGTEQRTDVAEVDDGPKRPGGVGFNSPTSDPVYRLTVGEDGVYRVLVRDLTGQSRARPQNIYRLVIRRPMPDYHVLVTCSSPFSPDPAQPMRWRSVLRRGGAIALPISVFRRDGFNDAIDVSVAGLPDNVFAPTTTIGPNRNSGVLSVSANDAAENWSGRIEVLATARHNGRDVVRVADFAALTWDTAVKNGKMTPRITRAPILRVSDETAPLRVVLNSNRTNANGLTTTSRGGKLTIPFSLTRGGEIKDKIGLTASPLPGGVKAEVKLADKADQGDLLLTVEPGAKPGDYGIYLTGKTKVSYRRLPDRVAAAEDEKKAVEAKVAEIAHTQKTFAEEFSAVENECKTCQTSLVAAQQELATLVRQGSVPADQRATLQQKVDSAQRRLTTAGSVKDTAVAAAATAQQRHHAAQAALTRLTKRVTQITENAKPGDRVVFVASNPITLRIVKNPIALTSPSEVTLHPGGTQTLNVSIERLYGFVDTVRLEPSVTDENAKLTVTPRDVPAGQTTADIQVTSAADSLPGRYPLTLKATLKFNEFQLELQHVTHVNIVAPSRPAEDPRPEPTATQNPAQNATEKPAEKTE